MQKSINTPLPETLADEELATVQGGVTRIHDTPDGTPLTAQEIPLPTEVWLQLATLLPHPRPVAPKPNPTIRVR